MLNSSEGVHRLSLWLAIASLCTSACYYGYTQIEETQWRTDDGRPLNSNELARAKAGCDLIAESADKPDDLDLVFWGRDYKNAYIKCMRSEGWVPMAGPAVTGWDGT